MDKKALEYFAGKKIKVFLKERIVYTGFIHEAFDDSMIFFDKFGMSVAIPYTQIERIEEIKEDEME